MIQIYASYISPNFVLEEYDDLLKHVDKQSRDKIGRFYRQSDAIRAILSNTLTRAIIIETLGMNNKDIIIYKNAYGKPYLKDVSNFHFNISHSGNWVVCAIGNNSIGIDIEKIMPIDFEVVEEFCTTEEKERLFSLQGIKKLDYFYDLWTLKESYVKALGMGLSISLKSFAVNICPDGSVEFKTDTGADQYFFKRYAIDPHYKLAVCAVADTFPQEIIIKSKGEILSILGR